MGTVEAIYDRDFVEWTREQAKALRAAKGAGVNLDLDWEHLAEEIEDMGKSERREVASWISTIIEHLLKLQCSSAIRPRADWMATIARERDRVQRVLEDSPSLRRELDCIVAVEMTSARKITAQIMRDHRDQVAPFPDSYTAAQVLGDWYPDPPA